MKKMTRMASLYLAVGSLLLAPTSVHASCATDDCCDLKGSWELGVELLYWKPCISAYEYARKTFNTGSEQAPPIVLTYSWDRVKPSNHPGWRLFATYDPCDSCLSYMIDWTYLRATDTSEVFATNGATLHVYGVNDLEPFPAAQGQQRAIYNRINLRANYELHCDDCLSFYIYGGFRLLDLQLQRRSTAFNADGTVARLGRRKGEFSGAGIELGVGGRYDVGCCIDLVSNIGITTAVGRQKFSSKILDEDVTSATNKHGAQTHCVPGVDARIGFQRAWVCDCFSATFEIGYELNHYFGALPQEANTDNISGILSGEALTGRGFGFAGPYASLQISY